MLPLFILAYVYCFLNVAALPTNGVTELKLRFPYDLEIDADSSGSTEGGNAYAYVDEHPKHADESWEEHHKHRNYTAVLTRFDADGVTSNTSCNIEFKSSRLDIFFDTVTYFLFNDKIVFSYMSAIVKNPYAVNPELIDTHHNFRVLHTDTCKYYEVNVHTNFSLDEMIIRHLKIDVLNHNDKFDVFLPDALCDGARCKYTFSEKGEQISGPVSFLPTDYKNRVMKIFRSTKSAENFVFVSDYKQKDRVPGSDVSDEFIGSQKLMFIGGVDVTELARFDYDYKNEMLFAKNSKGLLSVCRQFKSNNVTKINCMQFDENVVKINASTIVNGGCQLFAIYNLPTGGILMAKGSSKGISIEKWTTDNKVLEVHSTNDFESKLKIKNVHLNVGSDGAVCISVYYKEVNIMRNGIF